MPVIQCDIREGRSDAQKEELARAITEAVQRTIDAPLDYIYVLIRETPASHHHPRRRHAAAVSPGLRRGHLALAATAKWPSPSSP